MKIFRIDEKHNSVNGELDLGDISPREQELIEKALSYVNENQSRYNQYELGNAAEIKWEDGDPVDVEIT